MRKYIIVIVGAVLVLAGLASSQALAAKQQPITLCHRTSSANNPYVMLTVDRDAIIDTGKPNTKNKHDSHRGPVFDGVMKKGWGDIIPPFAGYAGLNWDDDDGKKIFNNNCQYGSGGTPTQVAILDYYAECVDVNAGQVDIVAHNYGDLKGTFDVDSSPHDVAPGSDTTVSVYDTGKGASFTVTIDGVDYPETVTCLPGKGGGPTNPTPGTPKTHTKVSMKSAVSTRNAEAGSAQPQIAAKSLPYTGSGSGKLAVAASIVAVVTTIGSGLAKRLFVGQI